MEITDDDLNQAEAYIRQQNENYRKEPLSALDMQVHYDTRALQPVDESSDAYSAAENQALMVHEHVASRFGAANPDPYESFDINGLGGIKYPKPVAQVMTEWGNFFSRMGAIGAQHKHNLEALIPGLSEVDNPDDYGESFLNSPFGTVYRAALGGMSDEQYAQWTNEKTEEFQHFSQTPIGQGWGNLITQIGGEVLLTAPIPLHLGGTLMMKGLAGAGLGAATTGGLHYVPEGESPVPYMLMGGVLGGAMGWGFGALGARFAQKIDALKGPEGIRKMTAEDIGEVLESLGAKNADAPALPNGMDAQQFADAVNDELLGAARSGSKTPRSLVDADFTLEAVRNFPSYAKDLSPDQIQHHRKILNVLATDDTVELMDYVDFLGGGDDLKALYSRAIARGQVGGVDSAIPTSGWRDLIAGKTTITALRNNEVKDNFARSIDTSTLDEIEQSLSDLKEMEWGVYRSPSDKALDDLGIAGVTSEKELNKLSVLAKDRAALGPEASMALRNKSGFIDMAKKNKAADEAWRAYKRAEDVQSSAAVKRAEEAYRKADIEAREARALFDKEFEATSRVARARTAAERAAARKEVFDSPDLRATDDDVAEAFEAVRDRNLEKASRASSLARGKAIEAAKEEKRWQKMEQRGMVNSQMLNTIALGGVGAALGGMANEDQPLMGAIYGALLLGGGPLAWKRLGMTMHAKAIAQRAEQLKLKGAALANFKRTNEKMYSMAAAKYWEYPRVVMKTLGKPGRFLADQVQKARDDAEIRIGRELSRVRDVLVDNGIIAPTKFSRMTGAYDNITGNQLRSYMQGELPNAPANVKKAGEYVRKLFERVLDESADAGMIDKTTHAILKENLKTKGYWPRVWNRGKMNTQAGKEEFVRLLTNEGFSYKDLQSVLQALLGKDSKRVGDFVEMAKRDGDTWIITREMAEKLLRSTTSREYIGRSSHLEHRRKLNVRVESLLNPFMMDDPITALTTYLDDTMRRTEFVRRFGKNDEHAKSAFDEIKKTYGKNSKELDTAMQFYYHNVGDPRAAAIEAAMSMSDTMHEVMGSASTWANQHLWAAQILQVFQAGVFGASKLAKHGPKGLKAVVGGLVDFVKDVDLRTPGGNTISARQWAAETGADLETALMQSMGEINAQNHVLIGNKATEIVHNSKLLQGKYNPAKDIFDTYNNSTSFLRNTGFIKMESFQRKWAALIGRRIAGSLAEEMDQLRAAGVKTSDPRYKKVKATMAELGLVGDSGVPIRGSSLTDDDLSRAGLRMSNEVNFRNTPDVIPHLWQNPYMAPIKRFKTFAYHTQHLLTDMAKSGDIAGLATYLTLGATAGVGLYEGRERIKSVFTGRDRTFLDDQSAIEKVVKGMMTLGGLGLMMDILSKTASNPERAAMAILGPAPANLLQLTGGAVGTVFNDEGFTFDPSSFTDSVAKYAPMPTALPVAKATQAITGEDPRQPKRRKKKGEVYNKYGSGSGGNYKRYGGM